jgi:rhamnosyltransferase
LSNSRAIAAAHQTLPRVAVILCSYNGEAWIYEQVQSILDQVGVEVVVYISDDCSTDGTGSIVRCLEAMHPSRVVIFSRELRFGGAAQNFLGSIRRLDALGFDFVALADQDDVWALDKLGRAICRLREERAGLYSSAVSALWPDGSEDLYVQSDSLNQCDYLFEGAGQGCTYVLDAAAYREVRSRLEVIGKDLIAQLRYHDWLIYAIVRASGFQWVYDRRPSMRYRQHASNDTGARWSVAGVRFRLRGLFGGWYQDHIALVYEILCRAGLSGALPLDLRRWMGQLSTSVGIHMRVAGFFIVMRYGRRRMLDRLVLAFAMFFSLPRKRSNSVTAG